jgi:hypothetical protein
MYPAIFQDIQIELLSVAVAQQTHHQIGNTMLQELIMAILTQTNAIVIQHQVFRKQIVIVQTKLVVLLASRAIFLTGQQQPV